MATQKDVGNEEAVTERLRLMEVKQRQLIEATKQQARRDAIAEYERERVMHFKGSGASNNRLDTETFERTIKTTHAELESSRSRVGSSLNYALATAAPGVSHGVASVGR